MESINQIGFYQLENLVLQRVNFTLMDLTKEISIVDHFKHLNSYYLNFLKTMIQKVDVNDYINNPVFCSLAKEAPIVFICDTGKDSMLIANKLENEKYLNVFFLSGGAQSLTSSSLN